MRIPLIVLTLGLAFVFASRTSSLTESKVAASSLDQGTQGHTSQTACRTRDHLSSDDFTAVMQTIQSGWSEGNARKSADCFAEDALYSSPPSRGHQGREDLYQHFGGAKGLPVPMKIEWHHLVFDPTRQL